MTILQALFFALIQAATEFLPISSSGHLLFLKGLTQNTEVPLVFDVLLHVGSLTAIVLFYRRRLGDTILGGWQELRGVSSERIHLKWIAYLALATGVTFGMYLVFGDGLEARFASPSTLSVTYVITTLLLASTFWARRAPDRKVTDLKWHWVALLGLAQAVAMLPGISRSGATIVPLLLLGVVRSEAGYFAFGLAIPAILGAFVFELGDTSQFQYLGSHGLPCLVGFIASVAGSYLFLKLLNWVLEHKAFWFFAVYTGLMAVASWILFGV